MERNFLGHTLEVSKRIQSLANSRLLPPAECGIPKNEEVLPHILFNGSRGYIIKIVYQINGTYSSGWYDACAVMMRRLIETLIIEAYEENGIAENIKDTQGNYLTIADLITNILGEDKFHLGRETKRALPRLKEIGHQSAHSRRFNAVRQDISKHINHLRVASEELLYLAGLK